MNLTIQFKSGYKNLNMLRACAIYISDFDIFDADFDFYGINGTLRNLHPVYRKKKLLCFMGNFDFHAGDKDISIEVGFPADYKFPDAISPSHIPDVDIPVIADLSHVPFSYCFNGYDCNIIFRLAYMEVRVGTKE